MSINKQIKTYKILQVEYGIIVRCQSSMVCASGNAAPPNVLSGHKSPRSSQSQQTAIAHPAYAAVFPPLHSSDIPKAVLVWWVKASRACEIIRGDSTAQIHLPMSADDLRCVPLPVLINHVSYREDKHDSAIMQELARKRTEKDLHKCHIPANFAPQMYNFGSQ